MPPAARRSTVDDLDVYYGRAHALQGVSLTLDHGVLGVVGRNGMGKTTLCNAITGLVPAAAGSVRLHGEGDPRPAAARDHDARHRLRAAGPPRLAVADGRRDICASPRAAARAWTSSASTRRSRAWPSASGNGGAQLSGGEQQMLAIGRALLLKPRLLVMDEPTEGLAPVIVEQVAQTLRQLATEGEIAVLLIEQNLGVAIEVADRIAVMVNGRIAQEMPPAELAADRDLQQRLLGVRPDDDRG